jgi:hypothetical protein
MLLGRGLEPWHEAVGIQKLLERINMYQVELVWNREFDFVPHGSPVEDLDVAIKKAKEFENMGDGERVKKTRIVDSDGVVVWAYGKKIKVKPQKEANNA